MVFKLKFNFWDFLKASFSLDTVFPNIYKTIKLNVKFQTIFKKRVQDQMYQWLG